MIHVQAGAGIVHDSIPENEQQECINKAKAVVRAAEEALRFASKGSATPAAGNNGGTFG
jgi:anthranilate synthase component 1